MTKDKALYQYFNKFAEQIGISCYVNTAVPDDADYPYLTYEYKTADFDNDVSIVVNMWFYTSSESVPNEAAEELREWLKANPLALYDGGAIWLKADSPFCQSMTDPASNLIKRRYILLTAEYQS
jgi:hypothetical protein